MLLPGLLLLSVCIACAPPPEARRTWRQADGLPALWRLLDGELGALHNLTVEADVELLQGDLRERATALVMLKGEELFRFEVRGPFYSHVFTAVQEGDSLTVYGPAVGGAWKGPARGTLLAQLTGIDLGAYSPVRALLGLVEPAVDSSAVEIEYPRADRAIATFVERGVRRRLWLDMHRGLVLRERIERPSGMRLIERTMDEYVRVGEVLLPRRVEIEQGSSRIALRYKRYDVERGLRAEDVVHGIPDEDLRRVPY